MTATFHYLATAEAPRRLSERTRELAALYLQSTGIASTIAEDNFQFRPDPQRSLHQNYVENLMLIAAHAPLRVRPEEKLVGAATYLSGVRHSCPGGAYGSISHVTVDFGRALRLGLRGLDDEIVASQARPGRTAEELDFLAAMRGAVAAMRLWCGRYGALVRERLAAGREDGVEYRRILVRLERVPEEPPRDFAEAVQALWLFFTFQRLCGNWSGLGRVDLMLEPYLTGDLNAGTITLDEAREYLAHFWIKGTEWKGLQSGTGDAQHYQNVILGGIDRTGVDRTNPVSHLILDVVEELHISDFPIAVRVNASNSAALLPRIARIQRHGGGIVSFYNEAVVLEALRKFGYPAEEAAEFTNDGCWEVLIPGRTAFLYQPFDLLRLLQRVLGLEPGCALTVASDFETLYQALLSELAAWVEQRNRDDVPGFCRDECSYAGAPPVPSALLSLLVENCVASGRSYYNRGAQYTVLAIHGGGLPDVANALWAMQRYVYQERRITLTRLVEALRGDWAGAEALRDEIAADLVCYGNDCAGPDRMLQRLTHDFAAVAGARKWVAGVGRPVGVSTFGRELEYAPERLATAAGTRAHQVLAANLAPTPGTDRNGPTAVVKSFCQVDFTELPNGCPLDLKFHASALAGEGGVAALTALLRTFLALGGFYLQVDVADQAVLRDAQRHPERYPNLSVRISGWSARFVTLAAEWQEMVIARTGQRF